MNLDAFLLGGEAHAEHDHADHEELLLGALVPCTTTLTTKSDKLASLRTLAPCTTTLETLSPGKTTLGLGTLVPCTTTPSTIMLLDFVLTLV